MISFGDDNGGGKAIRESKGKSCLLAADDYVAIDIETTGLDASFDEIIEMAAVHMSNGKVVETFQQLVKPYDEISEFITELTGITNEMVADAPSIDEALPKFLAFVGDRLVVGHNVNFDINFIYDTRMSIQNAPFSNDFVDTLRMSRRMFPDMPHHRLIDIITAFGVGDAVQHRALGDAIQCAECYEYMKRFVTENCIDLRAKSKSSNGLHAADIKTTVTEFDETSPIFGRRFVFTGVLDGMTRREAMQIVVDRGGECGDGVTAATNYLVLGNNDYCKSIKDGKSNKQKRAEKLRLQGIDIEIITENVFRDMIAESE